MSTERRWSKFWWQDWQRDPALRMCSLAARGLWMELLCIAHEGTPYGHVTVNGKPLSPAQIAGIVGARITEREVVRLLDELENSGVFSRTADGTIYSRRMIRDKEASDAGKENISKRWSKPQKTNENPPPPPNSPPNSKPNGGASSHPESIATREATREPNTLEAESESESESPSLRSGDAHAHARARATRLSSDFMPDGTGCRVAAECGLDIHATLDKFRDYWRAKAGKDATKHDWQAAWRYWCRNSAEFAARRNRGSQQSKLNYTEIYDGPLPSNKDYFGPVQ